MHIARKRLFTRTASYATVHQMRDEQQHIRNAKQNSGTAAASERIERTKRATRTTTMRGSRNERRKFEFESNGLECMQFPITQCRLAVHAKSIHTDTQTDTALGLMRAIAFSHNSHTHAYTVKRTCERARARAINLIIRTFNDNNNRIDNS